MMEVRSGDQLSDGWQVITPAFRFWYNQQNTFRGGSDRLLSMLAVFFVYGLAFFLLGYGVLIYPKKEAGLGLAQDIWLFAVFGLLHGANEWIDMFKLVIGPDASQDITLNLFRTAVFVLSFLSLLAYGINVGIRKRGWEKGTLLVLPAVLLMWALTSISSKEGFFLAADIYGRYLLAAPGIFLTVWALALHLPELREKGSAAVQRHFYLVLAAFVSYGIFAGLVVPADGFFPASVINYQAFNELFGFPVQVARAVCAVAAVYGMLMVLKVFTTKARRQLLSDRDMLEGIVQERTGELLRLNEELELEISEKSAYELELSDSLKEKEALLREIHHRVKNNMQIITSLLKLESSYIQDPDYAHLFAESTNRIKTMVTVQERLYASESLTRIDFAAFLRDLGRVVFRSYRADPNAIHLHVETGGITLLPDTAVPIALVIHELMVNSLNHGFDSVKRGEIHINVKKIEESAYELEYRDTGSGLPDGFSLEGVETLGLELVKSLVHDQLQGSVQIRKNDGAVFSIRFQDIEYRERI